MDHRVPTEHIPKAQRLAERAFAAIREFLHIEAVGGCVLLLAAVAALAWANSPFAHGYHALWNMPIPIEFGDLAFTRSLQFWINDGLMALFFLVVGVEIRREMHEGALSEFRQAILPIAAAAGGVVMPALIFLSVNLDPARSMGWAIPTATDIAFAVGVLALLGRAIPANVRILLLSLAIIDDIIAVVIIALFYSDGLHYGGFIVIAIGGALVLGLQRIGVGRAVAYIAPGAIVWIGFLIAGVHPALAGVVLGLMTPVRTIPMHRAMRPPVERVQAALHSWVAYAIMPLFALANAGIGLSDIDLSGGAHRVMLGVGLALCIGKPVGVIGASWLSVRSGPCRLAPDVSWGGVCLVGLLAGIGFTMSIFIAMLAFSDERLLGAAKLGVLLGSLVSLTIGLGWGAEYARRLRRNSLG
jgi:NhaA family Na+:H+ antiporter